MACPSSRPCCSHVGASPTQQHRRTGTREGMLRRRQAEGDRSGEADAAPQEDEDTSPHDRFPWVTQTWPDPWAPVPAACRGREWLCSAQGGQGGVGCSVPGSLPGPRSMHMKQDRPSPLGTRFRPPTNYLRVRWAARPGRGPGEPPPSWEEWGAEETTLPAQDASHSSDTSAHPPAPWRHSRAGPPTHAHRPLLTDDLRGSRRPPASRGVHPGLGAHAPGPRWHPGPSACLHPHSPQLGSPSGHSEPDYGAGLVAPLPATLFLCKSRKPTFYKNVSFKVASQRRSRSQVRAGATARPVQTDSPGRHSTGGSQAGAWPCPPRPQAPGAHTDRVSLLLRRKQ